MTLVYVLLGTAVLGVVLMLVGMIRDARKVEPRDPAYWRRRGLL